jgi:hypothetical protein
MNMSLNPIADRSPRARPVGDAPVAALLDGAEELARRWAIALILERPLAEMAHVPLDELAQAAPGLCAQIARALESDAELGPLGAGAEAVDRPHVGEGAATVPLLAALAEAAGASALAEAIEALRGVLWEAILTELHDPPARQVADLSDRLAFVCARTLGEALGEMRAHDDAAAPPAASAPARERILYTSAAPSSGRSGAVLVDEHEDVSSAGAPPAEDAGETRRRAPLEPLAAAAESFSDEPPRAHEPQGGQKGSPRTIARPLPWDTPLQAERGSERRPLGTGGAGEAVTSRRALYDEDPVMRVTRGPGSPADKRS